MLLNFCFHAALTFSVFAGGISRTKYPTLCQTVSALGLHLATNCEVLVDSPSKGETRDNRLVCETTLKRSLRLLVKGAVKHPVCLHPSRVSLTDLLSI